MRESLDLLILISNIKHLLDNNYITQHKSALNMINKTIRFDMHLKSKHSTKFCLNSMK